MCPLHSGIGSFLSLDQSKSGPTLNTEPPTAMNTTHDQTDGHVVVYMKCSLIITSSRRGADVTQAFKKTRHLRPPLHFDDQ